MQLGQEIKSYKGVYKGVSFNINDLEKNDKDVIVKYRNNKNKITEDFTNQHLKKCSSIKAIGEALKKLNKTDIK